MQYLLAAGTVEKKTGCSMEQCQHKKEESKKLGPM